MLRSFGDNPITGQSHESRGTECQDSCETYVDPDQRFAIAIVSDGHGGKKYTRSKIGSSTAVEVTKHTLIEYLSDGRFEEAFREDPEGLLFNHVSKRILGRWFDEINKYDAKHPPEESEMEFVNDGSWKYPENKYGATLVIAVMTKFCAFAIQLGDGDIVFIGQDGRPYMPMPNDIKCDDNITSSICSPGSWAEDIRIWYTFVDLPVAMSCSSDGLSTTFDTLDQFMAYIRRPAAIVAKNEDEESIRADLVRRSRTNRADDVSLALVCDDSKMMTFDKIVSDLEEEYRNRRFPPKYTFALESGASAMITGDYREDEGAVIYPVRIIKEDGEFDDREMEVLWYAEPDELSEDFKSSIRSDLSKNYPYEVVNQPVDMLEGRFSHCRVQPRGFQLADLLSASSGRSSRSGRSRMSPTLVALGYLRAVASLNASKMHISKFDSSKIWVAVDGSICVDYRLLEDGPDYSMLQSVSHVIGGILLGIDPFKTMKLDLSDPFFRDSLSEFYPEYPELARFLLGNVSGTMVSELNDWFSFLFKVRMLDDMADAGTPYKEALTIRYNGMLMRAKEGSAIYADDPDKNKDLPKIVFHCDRGSFSVENVSDQPCVLDDCKTLNPKETAALKRVKKISFMTGGSVEIFRNKFGRGPNPDDDKREAENDDRGQTSNGKQAGSTPVDDSDEERGIGSRSLILYQSPFGLVVIKRRRP